MVAARILVVDGSEALRAEMLAALEAEGFSVAHRPSAAGIADDGSLAGTDLLVLNGAGEPSSAAEICRRLRADGPTRRLPLIVLLDAASAGERLDVLSAGADDCITIPFAPLELIVRTKNILRRLHPAVLDTVLKVGDLTLDRESRRVHRQKKEVRLGPTEFRLLEFLMRSPGRVYSRSELRASVWGDGTSIDVRAVDVHIGRLRKGIGLGKPDRLIRTVRGAGYALGDR